VAAPTPPNDTPLRWRWPLFWAVAGVVAFVASRLLAGVPGLTERAYGQGIGPLIARPLSLVTGVVPFSVFEAFAAAYLVFALFLFVRAVRAVARRRKRALPALGGGALWVLRDTGVFVFLLYAMWGFNYARPALETRLGWPRWEGAQVDEVVRLAEASVAATNRAYLEIHGTPDAGVPTALPDEPGALEASLDEGWTRAAEKLALPASVSARHGRVKQPWISPVLAKLGLLGVYSPFTGEANVVRGLPAMRVPFSMAHEMAHQRGVAIEAEASFLGFLVCSFSPDPLARYAAASFAQAQLVGALPGRERRRVSAMRLPGVTRDLRDLDEYNRRNQTVAGEVQSAVNDRYLRANRVPGGIQSYGRSARLLIVYAREHPEDLAPGGIFALEGSPRALGVAIDGSAPSAGAAAASPPSAAVSEPRAATTRPPGP
jgi:hypothetical protein